MRLPRDISGPELVGRLLPLGYVVSHQTTHHIRLTTEDPGRFDITIPNDWPIRFALLSRALQAIADHHGMTRDAVVELLLS